MGDKRNRPLAIETPDAFFRRMMRLNKRTLNKLARM